VKEIVVGVTVLQNQSLEYRPAMMGPVPVNSEKLPDLTMLYHLKGSSAPGDITVFRAPLGGSFGGSKDWHWAIVGARGIPPAAPQSTIPQSLMTPPDASSSVVPTAQIPPTAAINETAAPQPAPAPPADNPQK